VECADLTRFIVPGTDQDVISSYRACAEAARSAVYGFEEPVAVVDIETTGFDPDRDHIIEVAAAILDGPEVVDRFHTLVDPGRPLPHEIVKLTGITDQDVDGATNPEAAVSDLAAFVGGRDVVAHNVSFDRDFLVRVGGAHAFSGAWIDSLQAALIAFPRLKSHRLRDLADAFGACTPSHRADDDVEALAHVWRVILAGLDSLPEGLAARIARLAPDAEWPLRPVISHVASARPSSAHDTKDLRRARVAVKKAEPLIDAEDIECACPPIEDIVSEFDEAGLAGRIYDGYERRDEQAEMAAAVTRAFRDRTHLAVEAGTGVGKSLAYLVPAARFAQQNGVTVGVATKTNSLMDQLVYAELPALCEVLDQELRYVSLKGYDHYPCLRKLDRYASELDAAEQRVLVTLAALLSWVGQSSWGDLDSLNVHWRRDVRGQVQASSADCTYKRCRFYPNLCYVHGVRRQAASAHIVATNHALLFCDLVAEGSILPPIRHWVVDEAHGAEGEAREQLSLACDQVELDAVLGAIATNRGGALGNVRRAVDSQHAEEFPGLLGAIARVEEATKTCATLTASFFDFVKDVGLTVPETGYDVCEARIGEEMRASAQWSTAAGVGASLCRKLQALVEATRDLITRLEEVGPDVVDPRADLAGLLSRLTFQLLSLEVALDGEDDGFVYSLRFNRDRESTRDRLSAYRLDVGADLAEQLYPRSHSVIYTSATIATGDDFSHFARGVGLDRVDPELWQAVRLESSYDFERQMAVFVPSDLPDPRVDGWLGGLEDLLREAHIAMGGSTLTLFTNRRDMDALYRSIESDLDRLGIGLLVQSRGVSAKRLRDQFIAEPSLSLFATKSFWEGFDAKGDTLRCVIVPRLPFGRPNDPLAEEREVREGRAAWGKYALPQAILELKQAAGRLIRSKTDTGCLIIADTRVLHKSYGPAFLDSLPVRDIEVMSAAHIAATVMERFGSGGTTDSR
jgi:ATP-dependent DNA helicase DinG